MERFADAAARMAGMAGILFGWTPDGFWQATPAELGALVAAATGDDAAGVDRGTVARLMEAYPDG